MGHRPMEPPLSDPRLWPLHRYMSPEVALSKSYNHLAEVFSFATVLWEMCALKLPFAAFLEEAFKRALISGFRPELKKK